jgi:hypothetical protein
MPYTPPDLWTNELLEQLPFGEDDRYERKSGAQLLSADKSPQLEFWNDLSEEIGAMANSFGGTVFVGIADDRSLVGIPSKKGATLIEDWFTAKIPALFELRINRFRVTRLKLPAELREQIGQDRAVIAIDVFDSELAPHQCKHNDKYFYRINSESRPAPHHYLSFLWARASPNMSTVATWWMRRFFDPVIQQVVFLLATLHGRNFNLRINRESGFEAWYDKIVIFEVQELYLKTISDIGEYFLYRFPDVRDDIWALMDGLLRFQRALQDLQENVLTCNQLRLHTLSRIITQPVPTGVSSSNCPFDELADKLMTLFGFDFNFKEGTAAQMLAVLICAALLSFDYSLEAGRNQSVKKVEDFAKAAADIIRSENTIASSIEKAVEQYESLHALALSKTTSLKRKRMEICTQFNATFGDGL